MGYKEGLILFKQNCVSLFILAYGNNKLLPRLQLKKKNDLIFHVHHSILLCHHLFSLYSIPLWISSVVSMICSIYLFPLSGGKAGSRGKHDALSLATSFPSKAMAHAPCVMWREKESSLLGISPHSCPRSSFSLSSVLDFLFAVSHVFLLLLQFGWITVSGK